MTAPSATASLDLVADIGGTNARFGLIDRATMTVRHRHSAFTREDPSLEAALERWLGDLGTAPRRAALAVAGPVTRDRFTFTNSPWTFSRAELQARFRLDRLEIINDFEALALSLPHLPPSSLETIGEAEQEPGRVKAVVGAGTGLGVGALVPAGGRWIAIPSEGGHMSFAPGSELDFAVMAAIQGEIGRVSAERFISGPGIAALYRVLAGLAGTAAEPLTGAEVTERALQRTDPIAVKAIDLFVLWLGRFAGDVALVFGARGGVYIGGGIAPNILPLLTNGRFRAAFDDKGRLTRYVGAIPIYVITSPDAPLLGAATAL